jgi:GDPmannose 4,6-dehydratase
MLVGDAGKGRRVLGWQPTVSFPELVAMMVESDLRAVAADLAATSAATPR